MQLLGLCICLAISGAPLGYFLWQDIAENRDKKKRKEEQNNA